MTLIIQAVKYLEPQIRLAAKAGKHKKEYKLSLISERTLEKVGNLAEAPIESVFTDPSYGKVHTISVYGKFYDFGGFILLPFSISTHTHTHTHTQVCVCLYLGVWEGMLILPLIFFFPSLISCYVLNPV